MAIILEEKGYRIVAVKDSNTLTATYKE